MRKYIVFAIIALISIIYAVLGIALIPTVIFAVCIYAVYYYIKTYKELK